MTEDEARMKVCPVGRMRESYDGNWDKGNCIGSKCMAWREQQDMKYETSGYGEHCITIGGLVVVGGYCGLAGKPAGST